MPLQKSVIDMPLAESVDTHTDPKQAQGPGALENAVVDRTGEIVKRPAFEAVTVTAPTSIVMNYCYGIFEYADKPVLIVEGRGSGTGSNAAPTSTFYRPIDSGTYWLPQCAGGVVFSVSKTQYVDRKIKNDGTYKTGIAIYDDFVAQIVTTAEPTPVTHLEIWDKTARTKLHEVDFATASAEVSAQFVSDASGGYKLFACAKSSAGANIRVITWRTATPTTAPAAEADLALTNAPAGLISFSTCVAYNDSFSHFDLIVAYVDGSNRLNVEAITSANASRWLNTYATATYGSPRSTVGVFATKALSTSAYRIICGYDRYDGANTYLYTVAMYTVGTSLTAAPNIISVTVHGNIDWDSITGAGSFVGAGGAAYTDSVSESNITIAARPVSAATVDVMYLYHLDSSGARTGSERSVPNLRPVAEMFEHRGRNYFLGAFNVPFTALSSEITEELFLMECSRGMSPTFYAVGRVGLGGTKTFVATIAKIMQTSQYVLNATFGIGGQHSCVLPLLVDYFTSSDGWSAAVTLTLDLARTYNLVQVATSGKDKIVAAGNVWLYDGHAQELGFYTRPRVGSLTTPAGGLCGAGVYSVKATYEWFDRHGQRHRSAPSAAVTTTAAANDYIDAKVSSLVRVETTKATETRVVLYRSLVSASVHYVDILLVDTSNWLLNSTTAAEITLQTYSSDSAISGAEALYTESGEVDNIAPPTSNIIMAHKNRVYLVPGEDRTAIWFSKERLAGIGLSFSDLLVLRCAEGGDITALGYVDDYRIIGKENSLYAFAGQGPNSQGFGAFTDIQKISGDVGVRDSNSVVSYADGMLFKSSRGFYLLDRSMQTSFIGAGLDNISGLTAATCVSAVHVPEQSRIFFIHATVRTVAVWDYLHKVWSTFALPSATFSANFAGAVNIDGVLYLAETDGTLWKQDPSSGVYDESPSGYTFAVTTPWARVGGIQGFQRVWWAHLTGVFPTSGTLTVKIYYDDSDTVSQTITHSLSASTGNELRIKPTRQKCEAMRMRIEYSGTAAFKLSKASLVCGVKGGKLNRLKAAATK